MQFSHLLHKKIKFSIKGFFSKCDQIRSFLQILSHLLEKSLMENFNFCAEILLSVPLDVCLNSLWNNRESYQKILILVRDAARQSLPCNITKKWILHLSPLRICKKVHSSRFPSNFFQELYQWKFHWEQRVFDKEPYMWWIWPWPARNCSLNKLLVKSRQNPWKLLYMEQQIKYIII